MKVHNYIECSISSTSLTFHPQMFLALTWCCRQMARACRWSEPCTWGIAQINCRWICHWSMSTVCCITAKIHKRKVVVVSYIVLNCLVTIFCTLLVRSEPVWWSPVGIKVKAYYCCTSLDKTATWSLQMEILVHFPYQTVSLFSVPFNLFGQSQSNI